MSIEYWWHDLWNTSQMEQQRDKYKKAEETIEDDLDKINELYREVKDIFNAMHDQMKGSVIDSDGRIRNDFNIALESFEKRRDALYQVFDDAIRNTKLALEQSNNISIMQRWRNKRIEMKRLRRRNRKNE